ncbi:MAG: metallophosphoesterase family protein [Halobacteriota archaeon]|nr:metallophosphoesterase family protein [Halobacteriota archaeon]
MPKKSTDQVCLISDIHGNLEALEKVLESITKLNHPILCLGDIVGYGASPNECIELVREYEIRCVLGNHDAAAIGKIDTVWFNGRARLAAEWTARNLSEDGRTFLENLKTEMRFGRALLVHGSPMDPISEYVGNTYVADEVFHFVEDELIILGHTHVPLSFADTKDRIIARDYLHGGSLKIDSRCILNPGSVGQPRDGNPMASYAILDLSEMEFFVHRVYYDVKKAASKILSAGLPESLAERLFIGH